jgi:hypothetical protein
MLEDQTPSPNLTFDLITRISGDTVERHNRRRYYSFLMYFAKMPEISRALFLGYRFWPPA